MKTGAGSMPIVLCVLLSLIYGFLAARNFKVQLSDIKCNCNPQYASNLSCSLTGPAPAISCNFDMQMKKEVRDFRMDVIFYVERMKKFFLLFKATDVDVCKEFHRNITIIYLQMIKDMTLNAGKWPKCPVPENFYYKFTNLTPNINYLPSYLPQVGFKFIIDLKDKKATYMDISVFGKVVYTKRKNTN